MRSCSVHVLQVVLENTSPTKESSTYTLELFKASNSSGLKVFVGGQPLTTTMRFPSFPFGGAKVVIEVFRGPTEFDYLAKPITLMWSSACQDDIATSIQLRPQYLKPCAKVEFHSTNVTFAISPTSYGASGQFRGRFHFLLVFLSQGDNVANCWVQS
jgi:hypothetical protein